MSWKIVVALLLVAFHCSATSPPPVIQPSNSEPLRLLFVKTTTTTSTITTSTTCTTSTAALTTCTIGRRRRGLFYDEYAQSSGRYQRGLFYYDDEVLVDDKPSAFLPSENKSSLSDPTVVEVIDAIPTVPLVIESGFAPAEQGPHRLFLLQLGFTTVTSYTTSTTTTSLTAFCSSTTGWPLCGNFGRK